MTNHDPAPADIAAMQCELNILRSFVTTIAFECRTSLTVVTAGVDLLLKGHFGQVNDGQHEMMQHVHTNAKRLGSFVNSALFIRQVMYYLEQATTSVLVVEYLISQITNTYFTTLVERNLTLITVDLPDIHIHTDENLLMFVLRTLLDNACRYTLPGGVITIRARAEHDEVVIEVADTGIGISTTTQPHIFSRFCYDHANPLYGSISGPSGSGLSLHIAKLLVERLGGRIWFESEQGVGTTFSVSLPATAT